MWTHGLWEPKYKMTLAGKQSKSPGVESKIIKGTIRITIERAIMDKPILGMTGRNLHSMVLGAIWEEAIETDLPINKDPHSVAMEEAKTIIVIGKIDQTTVVLTMMIATEIGVGPAPSLVKEETTATTITSRGHTIRAETSRGHLIRTETSRGHINRTENKTTRENQ